MGLISKVCVVFNANLIWEGWIESLTKSGEHERVGIRSCRERCENSWRLARARARRWAMREGEGETPLATWATPMGDLGSDGRRFGGGS